MPSNESVVQMHFSQEQTKAVDIEVQVLLSKGVVVPCSHSSDECFAHLCSAKERQ